MTSTCWRLKKGKSSSLEIFSTNISIFYSSGGFRTEREIRNNKKELHFSSLQPRTASTAFIALFTPASVITLCTGVKCNLEESS